MTKRVNRLICLLLIAVWNGPPDLWADNNRLRICGPPVADSLAFVIMADRSGGGKKQGISFVPWNSPDQVRALIAGHRVDCALITTAAAANLHQKKMDVKIAAVFKTPLWIVSAAEHRCETIRELGGTLLFPFGHREMPELLFNLLDGPRNHTLTTRHTGGALEAVHFLLMGKGNHALLAEPAAQMAVARSNAPGHRSAIKLVKAIDVRQQWADAFDDRDLFVSGLAVFGKAIERKETVASILSEYQHALAWIRDHPEAACEIARAKFPALAAQAQDNRIPGMDITMASGDRAFADALFFLERLYALFPASTGGKPPEADLFMDAQ